MWYVCKGYPSPEPFCVKPCIAFAVLPYNITDRICLPYRVGLAKAMGFFSSVAGRLNCRLTGYTWTFKHMGDYELNAKIPAV